MAEKINFIFVELITTAKSHIHTFISAGIIHRIMLLKELLHSIEVNRMLRDIFIVIWCPVVGCLDCFFVFSATQMDHAVVHQTHWT